MRLSEILNSKTGRLITLAPTASISRAAILMRMGCVGAVVVCDHRGRVLGVVAERDLVLALAVLGPEVFERCVGEVMTVDVPAASPHMAVQNVMRIMIERRARHLPVVEDGVAVGVVSIDDVLKSRLAEKIQETPYFKTWLAPRVRPERWVEDAPSPAKPPTGPLPGPAERRGPPWTYCPISPARNRPAIFDDCLRLGGAGFRRGRVPTPHPFRFHSHLHATIFIVTRFRRGERNACAAALARQRKELTVTKIETVLYTAKSCTTGGLDGASRSADGAMDVKLSLPISSDRMTNPEQLFAVGLSVCFIGAIGRAARALEVVLPADIAVEVEADLDTTGYAYLVQARLNVSLPGLSRRTAEALVEAAQELCPYARAVRLNVEVGLNLI